ncbi:MAG: FecR domain-containing protein [Lachnospiraceae bacterium]|nr:FecR domain-containing protein [Lachnospiraceae bacterium]
MSKKKTLVGAALACGILVVVFVIAIFARSSASYRDITVFNVAGSVTVERNGKEINATKDMKLKSGDTVEIGDGDSFMRLCIDDDKYLYCDSNTELLLQANGTSDNSRTTIFVSKGQIITEVAKKLNGNSSCEMVTPNTTMAIRGTIIGIISKRDDSLNKSISTNVVFEGSAQIGMYSEKGTVACLAKEGDGLVFENLADIKGFGKKTPAVTGNDISVTEAASLAEDIGGTAEDSVDFSEFDNLFKNIIKYVGADNLNERMIGVLESLGYDVSTSGNIGGFDSAPQIVDDPNAVANKGQDGSNDGYTAENNTDEPAVDTNSTEPVNEVDTSAADNNDPVGSENGEDALQSNSEDNDLSNEVSNEDDNNSQTGGNISPTSVPAEPTPVVTEPVKPTPAEPTLEVTKTVTPTPSEPTPEVTDIVTPTPEEPTPAVTDVVTPTPAEPTPAATDAVTPTPAEPTPAVTEIVTPVPVEPTPTGIDVITQIPAEPTPEVSKNVTPTPEAIENLTPTPAQDPATPIPEQTSEKTGIVTPGPEETPTGTENLTPTPGQIPTGIENVTPTPGQTPTGTEIVTPTPGIDTPGTDTIPTGSVTPVPGNEIYKVSLVFPAEDETVILEACENIHINGTVSERLKEKVLTFEFTKNISSQGIPSAVKTDEYGGLYRLVWKLGPQEITAVPSDISADIELHAEWRFESAELKITVSYTGNGKIMIKDNAGWSSNDNLLFTYAVNDEAAMIAMPVFYEYKADNDTSYDYCFYEFDGYRSDGRGRKFNEISYVEYKRLLDENKAQNQAGSITGTLELTPVFKNNKLDVIELFIKVIEGDKVVFASEQDVNEMYLVGKEAVIAKDRYYDVFTLDTSDNTFTYKHKSIYYDYYITYNDENRMYPLYWKNCKGDGGLNIGGTITRINNGVTELDPNNNGQSYTLYNGINNTTFEKEPVIKQKVGSRYASWALIPVFIDEETYVNTVVAAETVSGSAINVRSFDSYYDKADIGVFIQSVNDDTVMNVGKLKRRNTGVTGTYEFIDERNDECKDIIDASLKNDKNAVLKLMIEYLDPEDKERFRLIFGQ